MDPCYLFGGFLEQGKKPAESSSSLGGLRWSRVTCKSSLEEFNLGLKVILPLLTDCIYRV